MPQAVTDEQLIRREIAHIREGDIVEVRSWWKDACEAVDGPDPVHHTCPVDGQSGHLDLHEFRTLYGRRWRVGGCITCGRIYYDKLPVTVNEQD